MCAGGRMLLTKSAWAIILNTVNYFGSLPTLYFKYIMVKNKKQRLSLGATPLLTFSENMQNADYTTSTVQNTMILFLHTVMFRSYKFSLTFYN